MPELPEVETVRRGLAKVLEGETFTRITKRRADLRVPLPKGLEKLAGKLIESLTRRAKYILIHFNHGETLLVHLGMSGRMTIDNGKAPLEKHDHVVFDVSNKKRIRFNDARRFGLMDIAATNNLAKQKFLKHLGLEPLEKSFTGPALYEQLKGGKTAVKIAIMDQTRVVGVGNIYASEALFDARISPKRLAGKIKPLEAAALAASIKKVLKKAIAKGGSTLRDYVQADGELGYFQHEFCVYGRDGQPCPRCAGMIHKITQGARSTFYCPACQK